jgi:hypothetical protein
MALSAFDDRSRPPREADLAATLGKTNAHWNELRKLIALRFAPLSEDWGFSSRSTGWGLRLKQEKRTVLYMTPCEGHFLASFALGERVVKAARESALPASILEVVDNARKYAEGTGVRLVVKTARDLRNVGQAHRK